MDEVHIGTARSTDLATLLQFEQAMIEAERPFDYAIRTDGNVRYYDLEAMISAPNVEIVVAEHRAEIIGCGYARIEDSKPYLKHRVHAYLGFMYTVPEYRGKGVNKKIIEALEQWSISQGVTEIQLEVYVNNSAAIKAYEKAEYTGSLLEMRKSVARF